MITLTTEQARQIEEALEFAIRFVDVDHNRRWIGGEKCLAAIRTARAQEQAEQEPVLSYHVYDIHTKLGHEFFYEEYKWHKDKPRAVLNQNIKLDLYAAPVRTKDLTDAELHQIWRDIKSLVGLYSFQEIARAVIAADREKNK